MNPVEVRVQEMIFELGDLKAKAKSIAEAELAEHVMRVLRMQWEKFCENRVICKPISMQRIKEIKGMVNS